ncbi:MAG: hypothetical protein IKH47_07395, partial [Bacteroidaceae bacterium]|nr:hypothetical protein [Bacteroidaceae bacterium]
TKSFLNSPKGTPARQPTSRSLKERIAQKQFLAQRAHCSKAISRSKSALLKSNFSLKERIAQKQFLAMPSALTIEQITTGSA